jgi:hypothetical protein
MAGKELITNENASEMALEGVSEGITGAIGLLSDVDPKEQRDLVFWLLVEAEGLNKAEAAKRVGLHPNSGPRKYQELVNDQNPRRWAGKIIQKLQDRYRLKNALRLEKLDGIEDEIMDFLKGNPQEAHRYAAMFRQTKAVSGLLADGPVTAPVVNIGEVRNLMLNAAPSPMKALPEGE